MPTAIQAKAIPPQIEGRDILGIAIGDMLYIGDALFPGGNDYPAREAGVVCVAVRDPEETKRLIETIVACA